MSKNSSKQQIEQLKEWLKFMSFNNRKKREQAK
jgi:hypothetical protein